MHNQKVGVVKNRRSSVFQSQADRKLYWGLLIVFITIGVVAAGGLIFYRNPVPVSSPSFMPVVQRRVMALVAMLIAAVCQSMATVAFQSATNNRIITPSLLGFESLYTTIQTTTMFFFGSRAFQDFSGTGAFVIQVSLMILMCLILYGWLLAGKYGDLQLMLLIGVIMGAGLRSLSSFMRRLLTPSEFDVLQARLFGSVNNADASYFPIAIPLIVVAAILLFVFSKRLNVVALGSSVSTSLGVQYQHSVIYTLVLVSILMSVSTALIGPLTFYGFLVASLSYQVVKTYDHRYIFPMALAIAFVVITSAYFFVNHIFNAQGVVSVVIELVGGLTFLTVVLKKGSL